MKTKLNIILKPRIYLTALAVFSGLVLGFSVNGQQSYFYNSIDVELNVNSDSAFDVVEKQTYQLNGSFGYFYRDIELKDLDHISNIEVFDSNGDKLEQNYKISHLPSRVSIRWDFNRRNVNNELKSWTIKYKVHGGLDFFDDFDELYWNAVFSDRDVLVKQANVIVRAPAEITKAVGYVGRAGSRDGPDKIEFLNNQTVKFTDTDLSPKESLTIAVNWPKGFVQKPLLYRNQLINWLVLLVGLFVPVFVFIRSYRLWRRKGKDPKITKTVIAQYEPPEDLPPAVVGILIDQRFDVKEITATVINLAVRGYLKIKEGKKRFFQGKEYFFEKIKQDDGLNPYEQEIFDGIFKKKDLVSSDDLKNKFYKNLNDRVKFEK